MLKSSTDTVLAEVRSALIQLSLLVGLVLASLLLIAFSGWLVEQGGFGLLLLGLTVFWSAMLGATMLCLAREKRRRDRAIDAALQRLRSALDTLPKGDADQ